MCGHAARVVLNEPPTCTAKCCARLSASASGNARPADDAGVVDQDVDAPELLRPRRRRAPARPPPWLRRCCRRSRCHPPRRSRPRRRRGRGVARRRPRIEPPRSLTTTLRAPLGEQECVRTADPASRARDDRDPPLEAVRAHPSPSFVAGRRRPVTLRTDVPSEPDAANRSERRAPTQREVEGASRRDHRHLGAGLRAARATTPRASRSCARSTVSARAPSTTTSSRRRSSSPRSTIG